MTSRRAFPAAALLVVAALLTSCAGTTGDSAAPPSPTGAGPTGAGPTGDAGPVPERGACPEDWQRPFEVDPDEYPYASRCAALADGTMHYVDEGPLDAAEGTVLLVHGNPFWSFSYRTVADDLIDQGYRVVAPDLFGYGMSDKPRDVDYGAAFHAGTLTEFVRALDLTDVTYVLHDWGGPIGLAAAAADPDRVSGLVLLSTWAWPVTPPARGGTSTMHVVHDWGRENIVNAARYVGSGEVVRRAGRGVAERNDATEGTTAYEDLTHAIWGPFLELREPYDLLSPEVDRPVNAIAAALLTERDFLESVEASLPALHDRPLLVMLGDNTAFGPLVCDPGLYESRELCPDELRCTVPAPESYEGRCLDRDGEQVWPITEGFEQRWPADTLLGVWQDDSVGELLMEEVPGEVVASVVTVAQWDGADQ